MNDLWFFLGFLGLILILAISADENGGIFTTTSTSTPERVSEEVLYEPRDAVPTFEPVPERSPEETEEMVAKLYRDLAELKKDVREARLWETPSAYRGLVELGRGNAWSEEPEFEYLTLRAADDLVRPVNISDWYLESYVTDVRSALPQGDRVIERWRSPVFNDIYLERNEIAYLITGKSPIRVSFRENVCTGYLNDEEDFEPQLGNRCAYPMDELEAYGKIALDNDDCYDFVENISTCEVADEDEVADADLTRSCQVFVEDTFNYNGCVEKHRYDPFFSRDGYWYIYLNRTRDLWREEREIIRLIDEHDRIVDVLEY